jgi:hypothetical protein
VPLLLLLLALPLIVLVSMPLILIQRYRTGTARRLARPWVANLNLGLMVLSVVFFLFGAAVTTAWIAGALSSAATGVLVGTALGVIGVWLSRWESTPRALYYTPNRWLVLLVTVAISARVLYGIWRGWSAMQGGGDSSAFVHGFGVAESLAVGGVVIGYYFAYGVALRRRIAEWQRRPLRPMA